MSNIKNVHITGHPLTIEVSGDTTINISIDKAITSKILLKVEYLPNAPLTQGNDSIPGHPNCKVSECIECHNVSCAIYQGYENMP